MVRHAVILSRLCSGRALLRILFAQTLVLALASALIAAGLASAAAQDTPDKPPRKQGLGFSQQFLKRKTDPSARMLVQANEMIYDYHNDKVSAVGQVQIYYDGAILEADRVTYDRKADRLQAQGNVRYKTKDGKVFHGDTLDVTKDFREGFVSSMLVETPQKTRFAAARAERREGNITVFQSGVYTACEPCKDDPKKPLLWQVKSVRIIHNESEKIIYYENSQLEFLGIPIAYIPYFYSPDPTVKRQSGFLAPHFFSSSKIGFGTEIPYFWALAPNYDATVSVAPMSRQGALLTGEWRHRLLNGAYSIRASGILQADKDAFIYSGVPLAGHRDFRGAIESTGQFHINQRWSWGWDVALMTDRAFINDYSLGLRSLSEKASQVYLVGQGDRSYFDLRGIEFIGMSQSDRNNEMPLVHPVLDYSFISGKPVAGGEFGFKMNLTSLSRQEGEFAPTSATALTNNWCDSRAVMFATNPANCLVRALPGDYTRLSTEFNWKRSVTSSLGQVFTPFVQVRSDAASRGISNDPGVAAFTPTDRETLVRAMPAVGLETRWPFISVHNWGTQIVEPIAQVIARPNETKIGRFPNEDAQSMVFDDTNLFTVDKYSGYDRVEGGGRLNAGVQYTANFNRYGLVNVLFGQSYQLFGLNSYTVADLTNVGLQSGLDTARSDYVARLYFQPTANFSFATRFRFDKDTFEVHRFEIDTRTTWDRLTLNTIYALYDAQPLIGYIERREAVYQTGSYRFTNNWAVNGGVRYDLNREHFDLYTIGFTYIDECFALTAQYVADYTNTTTLGPVYKYLVRINLRTLGGSDFISKYGDGGITPVAGPVAPVPGTWN